ncbi:MAG: plasmid mobilization relaxosome protein MobC [Mucilaginibacter sp.]|uniref:plasmid mobilization relaxosome protein MobC n=1 Tax=Mucilaginibacter sp. TaxID=1882438 RepID=UPI00326306A8
MPRRKATDQEQLLTHPIILRVTAKVFQKLESKLAESDCNTVGEVARKIISNKPIKCFYKDVSLNPVMEELAMIRKELKAIGVNINQITRSFNQDRAGTHRSIFIAKVAEQYQLVDAKVERLLVIISKLAERWLQK